MTQTATGSTETQTIDTVTPGPVTTISFTQTVSVSSASTVQIITSVVTVPQVTFITNFPSPAPTTASAQSVGGVAPPAPATTSASVGLVPMPVQVSPAAVGPQFSGTATMSYSSSAASVPTIASVTATIATAPAVFTGAADKANIGFGVVSGVVGLMVFLI